MPETMEFANLRQALRGLCLCRRRGPSLAVKEATAVQAMADHDPRAQDVAYSVQDLEADRSSENPE